MIRRLVAAGALLALATMGIASSASGDRADSSRTKTIRCTVKLSKQQDPGPTQPGIDFAQITCSRPLGFGAQYDEFRLNPSGNPPSGDGRMDFKAYFDDGRMDGIWRVTFAATERPCDFNFKIRVRITGGTGDYRRVRGTGSGRGDFTDVENAPNCSKATMRYRVKLRNLP